ncbi:hypothetical protein TUM15774_20910 [Neisseria gonorrhoeae]|nr:hypothetical protein TUM15774_20910 [Neisseria gonorrhoeae]
MQFLAPVSSPLRIDIDVQKQIRPQLSLVERMSDRSKANPIRHPVKTVDGSRCLWQA